MQARVEKWGRSLVIRIHEPIVSELDLERGTPVNLSVEKGRMVLRPVSESKVTLEELLAKVTPENRHGEISTGAAVGRECF